MKPTILAIAVAALVPLTNAAAHTARTSAWFSYTMTEAAAASDPATGPLARGVQFTDFRSDLDYGDGHHEQVTGHCSYMVPTAGGLSRVGVCIAPGAFSLAFRCHAAPADGRSICRGELTGARDGRHNGLSGRVTYEVMADGLAGVGAWDD